ncbi:MAG: hypothetical protein JSV43_05895 [Methanobacteriota archaeon]|nr:MAG: hypothetical protein JSV43_05895 [Euryarchaeota archaeon]
MHKSLRDITEYTRIYWENMKNRTITLLSIALLLLPYLSNDSVTTQYNHLSDAYFSEIQPSEPTAGTTAYHTYDEMRTELFQIAADHSNIVYLTSIGKTYENRDLWAVKISDNPLIEEDEPEVLFYGMHHAREWLTVEVPLYIINFLTDNYLTNATVQFLVDERQTWIIPMVNPDGRTYDGEDDPTAYMNWRKSRVFNFDTSRGVDLNRNYGYMWGGAGASDVPFSNVYRGESAFSENETSAIRDLVQQHDFVFSVSYHSSGQVILYPWGSTLNPSPDDLLFSTIGNGMADRMTNKAGSPRDRYIPIRGSQLYLTSGSDKDWMYGEMGVYPFTVELYPANNDNSPAVTSPYNSFHPREDKIVPVCEDNLGGALFLIEIAGNPFQVISHVSISVTPESQTIDRGQNLSFQVEVLNDGNQPETYDLQGSGPPGWEIFFTQSILSIAVGDSSTVDMWVKVPAMTPSGDFELSVTAQSASASASATMTVQVPYLNDAGITDIFPFEEGGTHPMGNYTIQAQATNHGQNQQNPFGVTMEVWEIGPFEEQTVLSQGFESGMTGWSVIDGDGAMSPDTWHIVNGVSYSGLNSIWMGDEVTGLHSDQTLQILQSPSFSLKGAGGANLSFYHVLVTEASYDYAVVEVGVSNSWDVLQSWSGPVSLSFSMVTFDLSGYIGEEDVRVRFRFGSDEHVVDLGWYLDDIRVNASFPREDLIHGPVLSRTSSQLGQGESDNVSWKYKFRRGGHFKVVATSFLPTDEYVYNNSMGVSFFINPNKYRVFLQEGLNLVSHPLYVADDSSDAILSMIQGSYDSIWKYDEDAGSWLSFSSSKAWKSAMILSISDGWWINVSEDTHFDVTGVVPGSVPVSLKAGWNLVGYPTLSDRTVADALAGVDYSRVECFYELSPYHLRALSDEDYMTTGMGYWIYITQETVWTVNP